MTLTEPTLKAPASGVTVRMYRQGLGDCFLLAFPRQGSDRPFFVVIDCGVLIGTKEADRRMEAVAASLRDSTGGRIDVLVATHQHWDHLSAFEQARQIFDQIEIGEVWVAWTEDPHDELAQRLRARRETTVRALHASLASCRAAGDDARAETLDSILGFFGVLGADGRPSAIQRAMAYVLGRGNPPLYRKPGDAMGLPGVEGARVFVLGPPQNEKLLLRSDPSRRSSEVYEPSLALNEESAFLAAVLAAESPAEAEVERMSFPFDKPYQLNNEEAQRNAFFQKSYFGVPGQEAEKDLGWRRIDGEWLGAAERLALQLDGDTNNTSLVLAIELTPGGKVLLFPGDAQVGNWLSWHDPKVQWPRPGDPAHPVTATDLLGRTVLYKVGHHASHNATLREKGLELMVHPDLTALIPVDETMARESKGWDMPFSPLRERLEEKAQGRVLRADRGLPERPARVPEAEWQAFRDRCGETELYVEITIPA